ncbi:hypothetical protein [Streptomyces parvus]|uniref:hypothetical protein n=1 Tax=Streptomyces parvus TaxID=66428 RepID=UPI0036302DB9
MAMGFTAGIADFDQKQFDALDVRAGAASSYGRLRQHEEDRRWAARYLGWVEGEVLRAVVPVYRHRMRSWADPSYDPRAWGLPDGVSDEFTPATSLLVGGCLDRRTGLHVEAGARTPGELRRILVELARLAADEDRGLVFPYLYEDARDALAAATEDRVVWAELGREAHLYGLADPTWEQALPSRVRYRLRRDRRAIADVPMTVAEASWDDVDAWASPLIADHNAAKGQREPAEFVSFRFSRWQENPDVRLLAFTAESAGLRGVQSALLWGDELELYEIGLAGEESDERLALYLNLLFHQPIRYARSLGIDHLRLGSKAETAKGRRGGVFTTLHGGVLSRAETRRLARVGS